MIDTRDLALTGTIVQPDGGLLTPAERVYITATPTHLVFRDDTPFDLWVGLTERLNQAGKRINWYIADALNFGARIWREDYAQAVDATGLSIQTLKNISWIGRQIDPERRREDVGFYEQAEVAKLPPGVADELLDTHLDQGWTQKQLRDAARDARTELNRASYAELPVPEIVIPEATVLVGDATRLPFPGEIAHLVATSPPYALNKAYIGGDLKADTWRAFIEAVCVEAWRVLVPHGRLALNVPLDTAAHLDPETRLYVPARPTHSQALFAAQKAGFTYRTTVIWIDDQLGKSTARGTEGAVAPHLYAPCETIILLSKGDWHRDEPAERPSDIRHQDWLDWTPHGVWQFPGESNAWEGHPAPFPIELPRRLIQLLTFPGDTVLDPFCGSGTTILAAIQAGRLAIGTDTSEFYCGSTRRRVAAWRTP